MLRTLNSNGGSYMQCLCLDAGGDAKVDAKISKRVT